MKHFKAMRRKINETVSGWPCTSAHTLKVSVASHAVHQLWMGEDLTTNLQISKPLPIKIGASIKSHEMALYEILY